VSTTTVAAVDVRPPMDVVGDVDTRKNDDRFRLAIPIAWVVFGIQFIAMVLWSSLLYSRWGNTWDFALRYQGWWGIAHGHLDPYSSVAHRYFWQDHFELITWPLAPISRLWPGSLWALWIQDAMVVGGELGALYFVVDAVRRPNWPSRLPGWIAVGLVTLLLVANPWIYDSISFDFHFQSVGAACFAMLACREMIRGSKRLLALWVILCLACGDIAGTYLAAVGIGGILAGRAYRRRGALLCGLGAGWFLLVSALGGGKGSGLSGHYGYLTSGPATSGGHALSVGALLKGFVEHPKAVTSQLWAARVDLWAYSMSSGGLGLFTPLSVLPLLVLFESGAGSGPSLRSVAYENFGVMLFVAPLSVLALAWLTKQLADGWVADHIPKSRTKWLRSKHCPLVIATLLAVNAIAWGAIWIPQTPTEWLRTSPAASSALNEAARLIPPDAEVVASQGVMGRLCGRQWCYEIAGNGSSRFPLNTDDTYFVILPYQGIEISSVQIQLAMIQQLAGPLHAQLLVTRDGVWLFRLPRPSNSRSVSFSLSPTEPAWAMQTATGEPLLQGPSFDWAMTLKSPEPGYVLYGADWDLLPGVYQTTVTMASNIATEVEMWDSTTNVLLSRQTVPATNGDEAIQSLVRVTEVGQQHVYSGWGPFTFAPGNPVSKADRIEMRVWAKGSGEIRLYNVEVQPFKPTTATSASG
jgi:Predicted membrane protein (DUF2079)